MSEPSFPFEVVLDSAEQARGIAADVRNRGGSAEVTEEAPGLLPLAVLLVVVIPPGAALLALVINRIVLEWKRHGVLIDARGEGPPRILSAPDLPYGTVLVLTRDGDESSRSDLPPEKVGEYAAQVIKAVGGASASEATAKAVEKLGL